MLEKFLIGFGVAIFDKIVEWATTGFKTMRNKSKQSKEVQAEWEAHDDASEAVYQAYKKGEKPKDEDIQKMRDTGRRLMAGFFRR